MQATLSEDGQHINEGDSPLLQLYCPVDEEDFVFAKVTNRVKQFTKITRIQHFPDQNQLMVSWRTGIGRVRLDSAPSDQIAMAPATDIEFICRPEVGGLIGSCIEIGPDMYLVHSNQSPTMVIQTKSKRSRRFADEKWYQDGPESMQVDGKFCYWMTHCDLNLPSYKHALVRCNLVSVRQSVEAGVQELKFEILQRDESIIADFQLVSESVLILARDGEVTERSLEPPFPVLRKCRLPTFESQVSYSRLLKVSFGFLCLALPSRFHKHIMILAIPHGFPMAATASIFISDVSFQYFIMMKIVEYQGRTYCLLMQTNGEMIFLLCSSKKVSILTRVSLDQQKQDLQWSNVSRCLEIIPISAELPSATKPDQKGCLDGNKQQRRTHQVLAPGLAGRVYRLYLSY